MRYVKNKDGIIEVYRNKRKPIHMVKEMFKIKDGCIDCVLFDVCLDGVGTWRTRSACEKMEIRVIDEGKVSSNICDITFDIKFGQKRKGWVRVKLVSVPEYLNSCPWCVMRRVCHDSPLCSEIITEIVSRGCILSIPQHYRLCRIQR